jgi:hypothetical protein
VGINKNVASKTGYIVQLRFMISQHSRDQQLVNSFINFFNCGGVIKVLTKESVVEFRVSSFKDIVNKIIPFFDQYKLQGSKRLDYADFCKIVDIMKNKGHLTTEGLAEIREVKSGMNTGRDYSNLLLDATSKVPS